MINRLSHATVYVLDQASARDFYTEKLGFEVRADVAMGPVCDGGPDIRWLTVGPKAQPNVEIILADCAMGQDEATAEQLRELVAKGALGTGVATDDCRATYEELSSRGVVFLQEPAERPYGTEAVFRDDSGNWISLTERAASG
jgi:catechol 2,3-dioxygenase-like lactoylglutathione lyase family enzyme